MWWPFAFSLRFLVYIFAPKMQTRCSKHGKEALKMGKEKSLETIDK